LEFHGKSVDSESDPSDTESLQFSNFDLNDYLCKRLTDTFADASLEDNGFCDSTTGKHHILNIIDHELFATCYEGIMGSREASREESPLGSEGSVATTQSTDPETIVDPIDYAHQVSPRFVSCTPPRDMSPDQGKITSIRLKKSRKAKPKKRCATPDSDHDERTFFCPFPRCRIAPFARKYNMEQHYKSCHLMIKEFSCETCGRSFGRSFDLRRHAKALHKPV
jgi:hypothetical protein